jgi:hypothetical protein
MHALEIEGQAYYAPFSSGDPKTSHRELAEAWDFDKQACFDDPDHRFNGAFA